MLVPFDGSSSGYGIVKDGNIMRTFEDFDLLKSLTEVAGIPGREERVRELILRETGDLFDETRTDAMGNLICLCKPNPKASPRTRKRPLPAKKILLACHIDEIGFYVKHIDDKGFLRLNAAGGFDTRNLFARRVLVQGREDVVGVLNPAGRPIHSASEEEKKKTYKVSEFYIDLFLPPTKVKKLISVGDPVTLLQTTCLVGDAATGKAMDNRIASYVALTALRRVRQTGLPHEVHFVATVQEEIGCRGIGPATFGIDPDVVIALDVTLSCDTLGVPAEEAVCNAGAGAAIKIMDRASISDHELVKEFIRLAKAKRIPYQLEVLPHGGTDSGNAQRTRTGYRVITLSVPCRYVHTITESVHRKDVKATTDLLAAYLMTV